MKKIYKQAIAIWLITLIFAIINGITRELIYKEFLSDLNSHQLSSIIFIFVFCTANYFFFKKTKSEYDKNDLIKIGASWTVATIIFEFTFGRLVAGHSWTMLLFDYNLLTGRVWSLVLLTIAITPISIDYIIHKSKKPKQIITAFLALVLIASTIVFSGSDPEIGRRSMKGSIFIAEENKYIWNDIKTAIANCQADTVSQSHSRHVGVLLKNGKTLQTIAPELDLIFKYTKQAEPRCGRIGIIME